MGSLECCYYCLADSSETVVDEEKAFHSIQEHYVKESGGKWSMCRHKNFYGEWY